MGVREDKKRETRARLERAALDLFARRGLRRHHRRGRRRRGRRVGPHCVPLLPRRRPTSCSATPARIWRRCGAQLAAQDRSLPALEATRIALVEFSQRIGTPINAERTRVIEANPTLIARGLAVRALWAEAIAAELAARRGLATPDERARLGGLLVISILVSAVREWAGARKAASRGLRRGRGPHGILGGGDAAAVTGRGLPRGMPKPGCIVDVASLDLGRPGDGGVSRPGRSADAGGIESSERTPRRPIHPPMPKDRMRRVNEAVREVLSAAITNDLKDPRVGFVTVTAVDTSPDLRHAHVYVSVLGDEQQRERLARRASTSSHGYLQARVASELRLKHTPQLDFRYDDSAERGLRISELLQGGASRRRDDRPRRPRASRCCRSCARARSSCSRRTRTRTATRSARSSR